jgi:hypothetical protein
MIGLRFRSSMGRTLLRGRLRRRARPLGDCPRCGHALEGSTECWFDADRVMTEHMQSCPVPALAHTVELSEPRPRAMLRLA